MKSMRGWIRPEMPPITSRDTLVLVKYSSYTAEAEVGYFEIRSKKWYYKASAAESDATITRPILSRVVAWREIPELPETLYCL